jgi:hypothetical protein
MEIEWREPTEADLGKIVDLTQYDPPEDSWVPGILIGLHDSTFTGCKFSAKRSNEDLAVFYKHARVRADWTQRPEPKFKKGDRVRVISVERGYHHKDKLGQECVIENVGNEWCRTINDEIEYYTSFGYGCILESRLELVS